MSTPPVRPHEAREVAESFGEDPGRYDRSRPRYPDDLVRRLLDASPGPEILDVGCGTGISSRQLSAGGARVLGVDPDARMAEWARRHGTDVEVSTFEAWDPAGRVFDLVVAGQSWHWVDPAAGARKAAAVLRAGGRLAVFWNAGEPPPEVRSAFTGVYERVLPGLPFALWGRPAIEAYAAMAAKAAAGMRETAAFGTPEEWRFPWERTYTSAEWLDQVPTLGGHNRIPAPKLEALLAGMGEVVDGAGGRFTMAYTAVVATAVRTPVVS